MKERHTRIERNFTNEIRALVDVDVDFNLLEYHTDNLLRKLDNSGVTDYSFINELRIINYTNNDYKNLTIKFDFSSTDFSIEEIKGIDSSSKTEINFPIIPFLSVNKNSILKNVKQQKCSFDCLLFDGDNLLYKDHHEFNILPINEPTTALANDRRLLAKYVTVNSDITNLVLESFNEKNIKKIKCYNKGETLTDIVNKITKVYSYIQSLNISLAQLDNNQFVLTDDKGNITDIYNLILPNKLLIDKKGTSYDLSILLCSCLKAIDLHTIIFETNNHAYVGIFVNEDVSFKDGLEKNFDAFYNKTFTSKRDIILIDPETLSKERKTTINFSMESTDEKLKAYQGEFNAIDVFTAQKGAYKEIDLDMKDSEFISDIKPKIKNILESIEITNIKVLQAEEKDRFTFWEKKLLDLNESNPLVNMRLKETNTLKLISKSSISDLISKKDSLKAKVIDEKYNVDELLLNENIDFKSFESYTDFDEEKVGLIGLDKTLTALVKKSNSAMDETGSPTLYLCLGRLEYIRKKSNQKGYAPFMVLPIRVTKDKVGKGYTIAYDFEDLMINQTFFEYYKIDHPDMDFSDFYSKIVNADYKQIVDQFMSKNIDEITLYSEEFYIANLTFSHYIMWMDVRKRKEELKKNKVIESIIENKNCLESGSEEIESIDSIENYTDFAAPLPYDSTQLKAIIECGKGNSFILDGPPGTGKSQTIVNMIVNAFYHGKTVLFVAEKKAALDVVADRLAKISLGRFCLELHSNKANKADFFAKLRESMELGATKAPTDFEKKCAELKEKREVLLQTINRMHEKKYPMSLYDAIVSKEYLNMIDYTANFSTNYLTSLTDEKIEEINILLDKYISSIDGIPDFDNNPIKLLSTTDINFSNKDNIVNEFKQTLDSYLILINDIDELFKNINVEIVKSNLSVSYVLNLLDLAYNKPLFTNTMTDFMNVNNDEINKEIFIKSKEMNKLIEQNKNTFKFDSFSRINAKIALEEVNSTTGFFKKRKVNKKWLKELKPCTNNGVKLNKKELVAYLELVDKYNSLQDYIFGNSTELNKLIGKNYANNISDVDEIELAYNSTMDFVMNMNSLDEYGNKMNIMSYFMDLAQNKPQGLKLSYTLLLDKLNKYKKYEEIINQKYKIDYKTLQKSSDDLTDYKHLLMYASDPLNFNDIVSIASLNKIGNELVNNGLADVLSGLKINMYSYADIKDVFELSLANGYIKLYFEDESINYFSPSQFDDEIKKYKNLINDYTNLVIEEVSAKLTKELTHNSVEYASSTPIGRLKKSISSNGRGVTIRDTLRTYDDIIKKYFPCFLMSPLSAAQYLSVDDGSEASKFDLVIFDEASQIPTHEAIGPIARGKSLIVAGDPEQMPPSAYFSAGLELDGEDIQFEDAVSLLDECIAIELPRHRLAYHYRSKHESLIEFSNIHFYNSGLYTFPSPNTKSSMIDFKYVELKENKLDSSISKEEIDAILETFKTIYNDPKTMSKSVGIIVFNIKQQEKVEDAINELLYKDKALRAIVEEANEKTKEPWFVKSLENVQGDERDIIIISIGFRKSSNGNPFINGPLARENGQRRLNVAVSRSKERMIVISTIKYSDFTSESKSKSKGPQLLKEFLRFAEESSFARVDKNSEGERSIVYYIKKDLEDRGYSVGINIGNSVYKVDLAIMNKDKTNYALGILIDTSSVPSDVSCRDKVYVQQSVLNGLKWSVINVYALEYYKDPKKTIDKIIASLDNPYEKEVNVINPNIEKAEVEEVKYNSKPYKKAKNLGKISYENETGFSQGLDNMLDKIVASEYPISFNTIKDRVLQYSNITTMSSKAKQRLEERVNKNFKNFSYDKSQKFYWADGVKQEVLEFRTDSELQLDEICAEEILCAMIQIAEIQPGISKDDLYKLTIQALRPKTQTLNAKSREILDFAYNRGIDLGKLK